VETGTEGDGTLLGVDLDITKGLVVVGGDDDVDGLDNTGEVLVQILLGELELEKSTVDLVDDDNGLDALTKSLTQDSLGLNAHTFDGVDDNESTVGDTESGSDLRREINVTGRVDQVDQELVLLGLDGDVLEVLLVDEGGVEGDGGRLDSDTTLLLVGTSVGETGLAGLGGRDDTSTLDERVGEGGLSVIDCSGVMSAIFPAICCGVPLGTLTVGNDGHVPNVLRVVHETTDLSAQSVFQPSFLPMSTCGAGPCVRATYLLDGEAAMLLARFSFNP
jgi:hypothetical protein